LKLSFRLYFLYFEKPNLKIKNGFKKIEMNRKRLLDGIISKTMNANIVKTLMKCSVCFNAGYPEEVYTSHWVRETRDKNSRVVCPVIKNMVCKRCFKKGHNAKLCKVRLETDVTIQSPPAKTLVKTNTNKFDFGDESDEEQEERNTDYKANTNNLDALEKPTSINPIKVVRSWADDTDSD
jgi:hypothetical protein